MLSKERLRKSKELSRLTFDEIADQMNVSVAKLKRWVSDKEVNIPDANELQEFARIVGTSVAYLLCETDNPNLTQTTKPMIMQSNVNTGDNNTVTVNDISIPWYIRLPQDVFATVQKDDRQEIDAALGQIREGLKALERAQKCYVGG